MLMVIWDIKAFGERFDDFLKALHDFIKHTFIRTIKEFKSVTINSTVRPQSENERKR